LFQRADEEGGGFCAVAVLEGLHGLSVEIRVRHRG